MAEINTNCGVYLIVSPTNGRYVGSSKKLNKRFNRYKNNSCAGQTAIYSSLRKYGFENHKIKVLKYCDEKELLFWERCFGDIYLASANFPNGLNLILPSYDDIPAYISNSHREKVSEMQKKRFENFAEREKTSIATKKGFTDEVKIRMSDIHKQRFIDNPILRKERSEVRKLYYKNNPNAKKEASKRAKNNHIDNPKLTEIAKATFKKYREENKELIIQKIKQKYIDNPSIAKEIGIKNKQRYIDNPQLRYKAAEKTKEQLKKYGHPMSKKVINTETGIIYDNVILASKDSGFCINTFRDFLKGRKKSSIPYKYY